MEPDAIEGLCMQMCPESEIQMRETRGLVHKLEMLAGTENNIKPIADRNRIVKSYSRSAAGQHMQTIENLRPSPVLLSTINYLLHDVVTVSYTPWYLVYNFIMDRLRSVRQDMIIQRLPCVISICILQPIVRFHAYAAYSGYVSDIVECECHKDILRISSTSVFSSAGLCEENVSHFDPIINKQHLQECLKRLLVLYDEHEFWQTQYIRGLSTSHKVSHVNLLHFTSVYAKSRPFMEALYIIFNLGSATAIRRGLDLSQRWRLPIVEDALFISLSYQKSNWIRVCNLIRKLPPLLAATASLHLPEIRRKCLETMSIAYSSRHLSYPAAHLKHLLLYSCMTDVMSDAYYYSIPTDEMKNTLHFLKGTFDTHKRTVCPRKEDFVEDKLEAKTVPDLLLYD